MRGASEVACHLNVIVASPWDDRAPAALDRLAAQGYGAVVLPPLDPRDTDAAALREILSRRGLAPITIAGQSPGADVSSTDEDERAAGRALLEEALRLTLDLGGDQMNGVPYGLFGKAAQTPDTDAFRRSAEAVGAIADLAHAEGVMMTFEVLNRYETPLVNTAAQAMAYVAASGSENLRIHLDTFHMAVEESDMIGAIRSALPRLGYLEFGQSGRGLLSTGLVDVPGIVREAIGLGYTGRLGVEAFSRPIVPSSVGDMLAIWRTTFDDRTDVAADAMHLIRRGAAGT